MGIRDHRVPPRMALLSPSGLGNLGDVAIVQSLVCGIRRRIPDAELIGLTLDPRDTLQRHGIPGFTCSGMSLDGYGTREPPVETEGPRAIPAPGVPVPALTAAKAGLRGLASAVPGGARAWRLARLLRAEAGHRRRMDRLVPELDSIVVAGGGQLDEYWGGPFGHPYVLWRWARFARKKHARFLVLSVGTGTLSSVLARRFVLPALATAEYRSFRDAESRRLVGDAELTRSDPVVPDLAYAYPTESSPLPLRHPSDKPALAVSPMIFHDPRVWPNAEPARYDRHLRSLAELVQRVTLDGWKVVLFPSDRADCVPITEVMGQLAARLPPEARELVQAPCVESVDDLIAVVRGADLVVAARLHGVLLSHVVGRPVLALSHDRKVMQQMADMRQTSFCVGINDFDPGQGHVLLTRLWEHRAEAAADIAAAASDCRQKVEEQYDRLFGKAQLSA